VGRIKAMKTIDDWHKAGRLKGCEYKQISISPLPLKMENLFSEILKIEKPSNRSYVRSVPCVRAHGRTCVSVQRERREMRGRGYTAKKVPGSVDPNHQPLGDTARLRELGPLPDHVIICTYAVTTLTTLSCSELYSNNFTIFSQALETGSERKTAQ
jgi:hypothetical protein